MVGVAAVQDAENCIIVTWFREVSLIGISMDTDIILIIIKCLITNMVMTESLVGNYKKES